MSPADHRPVERRLSRLRDRLNNLPIAVAGVLWFLPTAFFWTRFVPALRPFHFETPAPSGLTLTLGALVCALPYALPPVYFSPRPFERGRLYRALGLRVFRKFAPDGDLINRKLRALDPRYRAVPHRLALRAHIRGTYSNERAHLALFLFGCLSAAFASATGEAALAVLMSAGNIIFNLYPLMHQRYKRARLLRTPSSNG